MYVLLCFNGRELIILCNTIKNYPQGSALRLKEYIQEHDNEKFWTNDKLKTFFIWMKRMLEYQRNALYDDQYNPENYQSEPIVVTFLFDVYASGTQLCGSPRHNKSHKTVDKTRLLGKYVHYRNIMTNEIWKNKMEKLREKIKENHLKHSDYEKTSIKIYKINIKTDSNYQSDEEQEYKRLYDFCYEELIMPEIPQELL